MSEITQGISANPKHFSSHALSLCILGEPDSFLWEQQCSQLLPYAVWVPSFRSSKELTAWPGQKKTKQNNSVLYTHKKRFWSFCSGSECRNPRSYVGNSTAKPQNSSKSWTLVMHLRTWDKVLFCLGFSSGHEGALAIGILAVSNNVTCFFPFV